MLLSEQNLHLARLISDRAVVIDRGHVRLAGIMAEIEAAPEAYSAHLSV